MDLKDIGASRMHLLAFVAKTTAFCKDNDIREDMLDVWVCSHQEVTLGVVNFASKHLLDGD